MAMLACITPKSLNKGSILYSFDGASYDDGSSSVEAHEWHVRSIQTKQTYASPCNTKIRSFKREGTFVNLVSKKKGVTWVDGDWTKYIAKDYQIKFEFSERLPEGIYTTPLQAIKFAIEKQVKDIAEIHTELASDLSPKDVGIWTEELACYEKELKLLKGRLTKITNQKTKAKAA